MKRKKIKLPKDNLKKECGILWAKCVKARAGWKSELSGKTENLNAHHLRGKSNYMLRFSLDNGFCLTNGEHFYIAHNTGRQQGFEERVKAIRGADVFEKLELLRSFSGKVDLFVVKAYLQQKLNEFESKK